MSKEDSTIEFTVELKDHLCSDGFPRVNFGSLVRQRELSKTPVTPESTNGDPTLPLPTESDGKVDISRHLNMIQSRKTYKGIREQDFHEVAQGYDTDDSFVDDSEAHEDLAPYEAKLEHGTFYVNFGKVVFSEMPHESSEDSPKLMPHKDKSKDAKLHTSEGDVRPLSPDNRKRLNCIIEHEGYMITPPKNKKRKDSIKFSPKMVLKRSKSFKGATAEIKKELTPSEHPSIPPLPMFLENPLPTNSNQIPLNEVSPTQSNPQAIPSSSQPHAKSKQSDKPGKQLKQSPTPPIDPNTLLLTKFSEANLLIQMELTQECFTPAFYEKNDIHKFASQIPETLTTILQLFFNHIQVKINKPSSLNNQESQFERCLILGKIYAYLKRKQDQALTLAIQNYLEHFFQNKMHSFELILDTILKIIQSAFLYNPLQTLLTHIQPYIDRINENDEDKPFTCKKRFKWSFGLKQLLGGAITAQIDLEKNGFGVCQDIFTNEQIILQFLNIYILPCWPKGRMKASKLYKVTLPFHEQFTQPQSVSEVSPAPAASITTATTTTTTTTIPMVTTIPVVSTIGSTTTLTTTPIPTTTTQIPNTKISNSKAHMPMGSQEPNSKFVTTQAKIPELPNDKTPKKHNSCPAKIPIPSLPTKIITPPSTKITSPSSSTKIANARMSATTTRVIIPSSSSTKIPNSPKLMSVHPNTLNPELIPVASQMSIPAMTAKKSPLLKQVGDVLKQSPKAILPKSEKAKSHSLSPYSAEREIKSPVLPNSYSISPHGAKIPTCLLANQNMLLSPGNPVYANTYTNPNPQTSEQLASFNQINSLSQNFAILHTYPETIIHLKPGSKESSPKNAKSNASSQ